MRQITCVFSVGGLLNLIVVGGLGLLHARPHMQQINLGEPARQPSQSQDLLIRLELKGGLLLPESTNLPEWSLYTDGEIIWTDEGRPTAGFTRQVRIARVTGDEILQLMTFVERVGFWNLENNYQPPHQTSADGKTVTLDSGAVPDQLSSTLKVQWKGRQKQVTIYPADWQGAPKAYSDLKDRLLQLRSRGGSEFQPQNFQLIVARVPSDYRNVERLWPFPKIDLSRAQSGVLRLTRDEGLAVAEFLRKGSPIVVHSSQSFAIQLHADPPRES
jgi:hypothetical protein